MATLVTAIAVEPATSLPDIDKLAVSSGADEIPNAVEDAIPAIQPSLSPIVPEKDGNRPEIGGSASSSTACETTAAGPNTSSEVPGSVLDSTVSKTSSRASEPPGLLEKYIQLALTGHSTASNHHLCQCPLPKIFLEDAENPHLRPTLQRDTVNRILLYSGSFNPPHISHRAVLHDGFFHSGADLNLVAAIVLPWTNVRALSRSENERIFLRPEDRGVLWTGGYTVPPVDKKCPFNKLSKTSRTYAEAEIRAGLSDGCYSSKLKAPLYTESATEESVNHLGNWAFVYPGEDEEFEEFAGKLQLCAYEDGFPLSFVRLFGADKAHQSECFSDDSWGCREFLLSNAGRDFWFCSNGHFEYKNDECGVTVLDSNATPWKTPSCNESPASLSGNDKAPPAPMHLEGYSPWESASISAEKSQSLAERAAKAYYLASGFKGADSAGQAELVARLALENVARDRLAFSRFKECHTRLSRVRYIPRLHPLPSPEVSSTRIRKLIVSSKSEEEVEAAMQDLALNPTLLARIIAGKAGRPTILSTYEQFESWYDQL